MNNVSSIVFITTTYIPCFCSPHIAPTHPPARVHIHSADIAYIYPPGITLIHSPIITPIHLSNAAHIYPSDIAPI